MTNRSKLAKVLTDCYWAGLMLATSASGRQIMNKELGITDATDRENF